MAASDYVQNPIYRLRLKGRPQMKRGLDTQEVHLKHGLDPRCDEFGLDPDAGTFVDPDGRKHAIESERGNYLAFYDGVAGAILDGSSVPVRAEDARSGIALIDLARRAAAAGRLLEVPAASWMGERGP